MLFEIVGGIGLFALTTLGLGWPVACRLALRPAEKIVATTALSLLGVFLLGWTIYVFRLPAALVWIAPGFAAIGLIWRRESWLEMIRDEDTRSLLAGQAIVTATCVGWLALIASYSGGDWVADWLGHWYRVRFFVEHWPRETLFFGADPLTSRPPLANIVTGVFAQLTRVDFARYQLFTTLHNSLVFLPAALLARRWGGARAGAVLVLLFLVNPLVVQNATYAWTKLSTAAFVLTALYFFLRALESRAPRAALPLTAACLGAGLLCHYSAGPYIVVLVIGWCAFGWPQRRDATWWKITALSAAIGAGILMTWFGWSLATYGMRGTFLANPSVNDQAATAAEQATRALLNVRDTLLPHFLRDVDFTPLAQQSTWGAWRDWVFQVYQRNLIFAAGSVGGMVILVLLVRTARTATPAARRFWASLITGASILGIAAHGGRDVWGNAHICEQPVVLLGLAFLAAHLPRLKPWWIRLLVVGSVVDFTLGILLQMGAQSFLLDRWLTPNRPAADYLASYSEPAQFNLAGKVQLKLRFLSDAVALPPAVTLVLLATLLVLAALHVRQTRRARAA